MALRDLSEALRAAIDMIDASSFGGHKTYRCLTVRELERLAEIRQMVTE